MKKTLLVLLALMMTAGLCMAQTTEMEGYFTRSGMATQEMQADGLVAAHPTFPMGTKVRITNVSNGHDIEATIVGQIPLSGDRIIDLAHGAAHGLGFQTGEGGPVVITAYTLPSRSFSPPATDSSGIGAISPPESPENPSDSTNTSTSTSTNNNNSTSTNNRLRTQVEKETIEKTEKSSLPFNITINNYLTNTNTNTPPQERQQERPTRKGKDTKPPDAAPPPASQAPPAVADTPPASQPQQSASQPPASQPTASSLITAPPVADVQIVPALPNPHSDKTYRLLVGNYDNMENASLAQQQLQAVGFEVEQEQLGDWCKVYASGIPAASVFYAAKRLGAIGFAQVWVYE